LEQGTHQSYTPTFPQKLGERGALSLDVYISQMTLGSLRKTSLGHKADRSPIWSSKGFIHISKRGQSI